MSSQSACLLETDPSLAQEEKWKPNKEDCKSLFSTWGSFYNAKPGDAFGTVFEAGIAGLFQLAKLDSFGEREAGFGIYSQTTTEGSFLGFGGTKVTEYLFTPINESNKSSWDYSANPYFMDHLRAGSLRGWGHSHPSSNEFSYYIPYNGVRSSGTFMVGDMTFHNLGSAAFLIGNENRMLYELPSRFPKTFGSAEAARGFMESVKPVGRDVPGAPSPDVIYKMKQCVKAGY